jgi:hypothetical protein
VRTLSWLCVSIGQLPVSQARAERGGAASASSATDASVLVKGGTCFTRVRA